MDPREISEQLFEDVKEAFLLVAAYPAEEIGDSYEKLSALYQGIAVCHLLQSGASEGYRENLLRSAHARRFYLSQLAAREITNDRRLALSRTEAFLDAVAAGNHRLAAEVGRLSVTEWHEGWEYEDDFCYYRCLHLLVDASPSQESAAVLARYEKVLDGEPEARFLALRALHDRSAEPFVENLVEFMQQRHLKAEERKEVLLEPDFAAYTHWPRTFISVEGVALISLARAAGMQIGGNIPLCPPEAQLPVTNRDTEDFFQGLHRELRAAGRAR